MRALRTLAYLDHSVLSNLAKGTCFVPLQEFTDGPWRGNGGTRFDVDLLRVRQVRVTIGVQVSSPAFRSTGAAFRSPGFSRSARRRVPDVVVQFDVAPRNAASVD